MQRARSHSFTLATAMYERLRASQCDPVRGLLDILAQGSLHKEDMNEPVMADFGRRCGECFSLKTIGHPDVKLNGCQYGSILLSPETVIYSKAQCL